MDSYVHKFLFTKLIENNFSDISSSKWYFACIS